MKKSINLSVVLATYNEEANLKDCLDSAMEIADEIVIVDGGSQDKTLEIAKSYSAIIVQTDNPPIFHINKQKAVDKAKGKWILQLDGDERLTSQLRREIKKIVLDPKGAVGFNIARKNIFCGKWLKYGGMYPDHVIRLFKNGKGHFPCKSVHEQIEIDGKVVDLVEPMIHNTYPMFKDYMKKADTYTSLTAQEMIRSNIKNGIVTIFKYVLWKPILRFLSLYIRHKGILDGWWGFVWSAMSALHFPMAYIKFIGQSANIQQQASLEE